MLWIGKVDGTPQRPAVARVQLYQVFGAGGNAGLINGLQQLLLGEVEVALAGGVSEAIRTFGIFASFKAQGALAVHDDPAKASRPFDKARNGIVVSEGGAVYVLETLARAQARGAKILGEIVGYAMNSELRVVGIK